MSGNQYKWVSIPEAQHIVLNAVHPLGKQRLDDILASVGYVLAEDVLAKEPLPPFPASIKVQKACPDIPPLRVRLETSLFTTACGLQDGYAVVAADGPGDYDVAFEALAGTAAGQLTQGHVAYITTGHPLNI